MCMANLVCVVYLVTPVTGTYINTMLSNGLDLMHVFKLITCHFKHLVSNISVR